MTLQSRGDRMRHVLVLGLLAIGAPAFGAGPAAPLEPCFAVIPAAAEAAPFGPILLDRCTGTTWLLAKQQAVDASGQRLRGFVRRWHPLSSSGEEAVLTGGGSRVAGEITPKSDKSDKPKTAPEKSQYAEPQ